MTLQNAEVFAANHYFEFGGSGDVLGESMHSPQTLLGLTAEKIAAGV